MNILTASVIAVSLGVLSIATASCYLGDGGYFHRRRVDAIPYVWMAIFCVSSFWIGASLSLGYTELFLTQISSTLFGLFLGWLFIEAFGYEAVHRVETLVQKRLKEGKGG